MNPQHLPDAIENNARGILTQVDRVRNRLNPAKHQPELEAIVAAAWAVIGHAAALRRQRRRPGDVPLTGDTESPAVRRPLNGDGVESAAHS